MHAKKTESDGANVDAMKSTSISKPMAEAEEGTKAVDGDTERRRGDSTKEDVESNATQGSDADSSEDEEERPPFQLPRRFRDPNNALILCDGLVHAGKRRGTSL
jgi:hypothetical protein